MKGELVRPRFSVTGEAAEYPATRLGILDFMEDYRIPGDSFDRIASLVFNSGIYNGFDYRGMHIDLGVDYIGTDTYIFRDVDIENDISLSELGLSIGFVASHATKRKKKLSAAKKRDIRDWFSASSSAVSLFVTLGALALNTKPGRRRSCSRGRTGSC